MIVFFILYNYYLIVREYIISCGYLSYKFQYKWGLDIYQYNKWLYKSKQTVNDKSFTSKKNKILMICNHESLVDFMNIQIYLSKTYPEYRHIFIADKLNYLPLISNFVNKNNIMVDNNKLCYNDDIEHLLYNTNNNKFIVVLFIEGCIYRKYNIEKSNKWCDKIEIPRFNNLLCPRTKAFEEIIQKTKFDSIIQTIITYPDDIHRIKARKYIDFFTNHLPRISHIFTYDITNLFYGKHHDLYNTIMSHWREVDNIIQTYYNEYTNLFDNFIKNKHIFHDLVIEYSDITWNSSKYLIYFIPLSYFTYGFYYAIGVTLILYTSYQYHVHHKLKKLDMFVSSCMVITSYICSYTMIGCIIITLGVILYMIEKIIEYSYPKKLILYYIHSSMHMFVFVHIVIEFLYKHLYIHDTSCEFIRSDIK
jgi:hypothetical protein